MRQKGLSTLILLMFLLTSCAGNKELNLPDKERDLVESFDMDDKDIEKFKTIATPSEVTPEVEKKEEAPVQVAPKKKLSKKELKKIEKAVKEKAIEIEAAKEEPTKEEDYPKEFAKYDAVSSKFWNSFKPRIYEGEKFVFEVSYIGVTAGTVTLLTLPKVQINGKSHYHFSAELISAEYYSYIYALKDRLESFIEDEQFIPVKYFLIQRESGQKVDDLQIFDHENLKTTFWYKREKKDKDKKEKKEAYIPKYFQDSFSPLYFMRGFPLKKGDVYEFPVVSRAKYWLLKVTVVGEEEIKVMGQKINAIKLSAETHFPGVLKKSGDIHFWYSADKLRKLLKFSAKVNIGTVEGILIDYAEGK